jgi:hypothetical protein
MIPRIIGLRTIIALLKDGVIGKEEFLKLIESDKKSTTPSYYQ